jgi:ADP-ribose pyrophosphatase
MTGRTFTHPSVLQGIADGAEWADPIMDPAEIDWAPRQARAAIPFKVVNGRPVNPCQKTGIEHGRNELGQWDPRR